MSESSPVMEKIVALCKRRGFIFQSSEIYGGIAGFWDYGPLGTELKRNVKDTWWKDMVRNPPPGPNGIQYQMVGLDCSIIMNPKVWEASGHVGGFSDPMVDCRKCKSRFRADQVVVVDTFLRDNFIMTISLEAEELNDLESYELVAWAVGRDTGKDAFARRVAKEFKKDFRDGVAQAPELAEHLVNEFKGAISKEDVPRILSDAGFNVRTRLLIDVESRPGGFTCPRCLARDSLTEPREFNLMFQTFVGAVQDDASVAYLRPETAQGIFANFKNVMDSSRVKIPFGIAQIGKAFRNEINPRNFTFRSREFEQMEIEFFCKPDKLCRAGEVTAMQWYEFWRDVRLKWYESLGIQSEKLRPREQTDDDLAHYSDACTDIEYLFPFSDEPQELEGVAHRGDYDLCAHGKAAKGKENAFAVVDDQTKERYVPHVIEPSAGVDRFTLAVICEAYAYDENRASPEFLKIHPRLAPIKAAVFPLVAKDGMPEIAEPIYREIKKLYPCQYDAKQSIGKRYARMDEAGTPFCFTIDGQTKEDHTVTVRHRDTAHQDRISADPQVIARFLEDKLNER